MKYKICLILIFSFCMHSFGQNRKPAVAVLWFENRSSDRNLSYLNELLPEAISVELSKFDRFILVEREDIRHAFEEILLSEEGFVSPEEKIKEGMVTPADYIISGWFTKDEEDIIITLTFFDRESNVKKIKDFRHKSDNLTVFGEAVKEFIDKEMQKVPVKVEKPVFGRDAGIVLFLDVRNTYFSFEDSGYSDSIYAFPFACILAEEMKNQIEANGVRCSIAATREELASIVEESNIKIFKFAVQHGSEISPMVYNPQITVLLTTENDKEVFDSRATAIRKTFTSTIDNPGNLNIAVAEYILRLLERPVIVREETSPKLESLFYYSSHMQQRLYQDNQSALNEIYKSLYLYPDFQFYWYILSETSSALRNVDKAAENRRLFLHMADWDKYYCLYENVIWLYIFSCAQHQTFSCKKDLFLIPIVEEIVEKRNSNTHRTREMALVLSRLYICGGTEDKYQRLRNKGYISEEELYGNLSLLYLFEKLNFTNEEKEDILRLFLLNHLTDFEKYKNMHYMYLPRTVRERYQKTREKQKEFLLIMNHLIKRYPMARTNVFLFLHTTKHFEEDLVDATLERIAEDVPDSYIAYYQKVKILEQAFLSGTGDKVDISIKIVDIAFGPLSSVEMLNDKWMPMNFLREYIKNGKEEDILILVSEFFKKAGIQEKTKIADILPENLRKKLISISTKKSADETLEAKVINGKQSAFKALISKNFDFIAENIRQCGWSVDIFSADMKNFDDYQFIMLSFADNILATYDKQSGKGNLRTDILNSIVKSKNRSVFILVLPHYGIGDSNLFNQLNQFLGQFDYCVDREKKITSKGVFLSSKLKEAIDYHGSLLKTDNIIVHGYPLYGEKGNPFIKSSEGDYNMAVSLPIQGGKFVITGDFWITGSKLVQYNICRILLSDISAVQVMPLSFIKEIESWNKIKLPSNLPSAISGFGPGLSFYSYVEPLERWISTEQSAPASYNSRDLAAFKERYEELVKDSPDEHISMYLREIYLEKTGISYIYLGDIRKGVDYLLKLRTLFNEKQNFSQRDKISIEIVFTLLKEELNEEDYERCYGLLKDIKENYWLLMSYDLEGRLKEKEGRYAEAVDVYGKMYRFMFLDKECSQQRQYLEYALFRQASLLYTAGEFEKARKDFIELLNAFSKDWDLRPNFMDKYTFFTFSSMGKYGFIPVPFSMQIASYLYLKEISKQLSDDFVYQKEAEELLEYAREERKIDKDFQKLVSQIERVLKQ